jgi:hopanoid biosynthesis associated protein HpnK
VVQTPLIINGDDFGYSEAVNRAIVTAHQNGVLTSASLMVSGDAFDHAVEMARANPDLAVGLHLVLVLGRAVLPSNQIPAIVDDRGNFLSSSFRAGLKYFFDPSARRQMRREMRAQFERFLATGLTLSHIDGHTHLHMHPTVFGELIDLCEEYGVRRLRIVKGEIVTSLRLDRRHSSSKIFWGVIFNLLGGYCEYLVRKRGFVRPEKVYGLLQSGDMNEQYLLGLLERRQRTASIEVYSHPIAHDAGERERRENPGGVAELDALVSPRVRMTIEAAGFRLATYQNLTTSEPPQCSVPKRRLSW